MTKQVYELAAELGMRSERLVQLLEQEGFHIESVLDQMDGQTAAEIRRELEASRSRWSRLKTSLRRRLGVSRLPSTATLSEQEEEELDELVSQQEERDQPVSVALELDEEPEGEAERESAEARLSHPPAEASGQDLGKPKPPAMPPQPVEEVVQAGGEPEPAPDERLAEALEPTVPEAIAPQAEVEELPVEEAREPLPGLGDASVEAVAPSLIETPSGEGPVEISAEPVSADEELPAGTEIDAPGEESLLATLDRIAQMEEPEEPAEGEAISADALLEEELEAPHEPEAQEPVAAAAPEEEERAGGPPPAAQAEEVLESSPSVEAEPALAEADAGEGDSPSGEAPLTADELPERQSAAAEAQSEQEPSQALESSVEDGFEEREALQQPVFAPEAGEEEPEAEAVEASMEAPLEDTRREGTSASEDAASSQPAEGKTVTIDELLGTVAQEEQPKVSESAAASQEGAVDEPEEDLLDTQSLLGLEFSEQSESESQAAGDSAPAKKAAEGVRVEELLGVSESREQRKVRALSPLARLLQYLASEIGTILRHPGVFLKSLSNLELVIVSLAFLLTLSGGFYAFYRWYNFNRPGMDERFFQWAESLRKVGHYEDAIDKYQMVLKYHPGSERVEPSCFGIADARYRLERFREAIPAYEKALALHEISGSEAQSVQGFPDFLVVPQARLNLTRSLLQVGFYEKAKEELARLAAAYPGEEIGEESRLLLGELYTQWAHDENQPEKYRNAVAEYHLALNEYPGSQRRAELMSRLGDAYRALYTVQAEEEKDRQLLQEAAAQYEQAAKVASDEGWSQAEVGRLRVAWADTQGELGATRLAIEAYDRLLGTGLPMDLQVEVLEKIARGYLKLEDLKQAERWAQELIDYNPDDSGLALAYYIFGDAEWEREENRDYTRMMQAYQKALQLDDQSGPQAVHSQRAFMRMTYVLYRMNNNCEEAAEKYRTIIAKYPDGPYTYRAKFFLAECLQSLGRHLEAADAYGRLIDDYSTTVYVSPLYYRDALYRRGDCLLAGGQAAEAVRAYQAVLQELGFPESPEAIIVRERLADAYIALANLPQAEKVLVNLREKFPQADEDGGVSLKLAGVREGLFEYDGSRQVYLDLIRHGRDATAVQEAFSRLGASYLAQLPGVEPREAQALRLAAAGTYEAMLRRFPNAIEADLEAGRVYRDLGDGQRATACLEGFLKRAGSDDAQVEAAVLLGEIAWEGGRTDEAAGYFQLLEQMPVLPGDEAWRAQGCYRLAECYRQRQELAEAKAEYEKVLAEFPDSPWAKEADWKLNNVDWQLQLSQLGAAASL